MSTVTYDKKVLDKMIRDIPRELDALQDKQAETIVNNIKLSFGTSPPGRTYKRGHTFHVASIPRFPPNVDRGELRSKISWEAPRRGMRRIWSKAGHSEALELGTTKMAPRPYMVPEMMKAFTRLMDDLKRSGLFR